MKCSVAILLVITAVAHGQPRLEPTVPGDHIDKLKNLPDNTWLDLGPPTPDPKFGKARGRAWGARTPYAQDLRGAFLAGEGVHGYVKTDGHYMDDLWFYDLNAHQWNCLYSGADTKNLNLHLNDDGFETDENNHPLPVAQLVHSYENLTYDPDLHRFLFMPCPGDYWKKSLGLLRNRWLKDAPRITNASPWLYDAKAGHFDRFKTKSKSPPSGFGDVLIYIPTLKKTFFWHHDGVWFYDAATNDWTDAHAQGKFPPFGIDPTAALDTRRNVIYIGGGSYPVVPADQNALWIFDLNTNGWRDPKPKNIPGSNSYNTNISVMEYDTQNDKLLLFRHSAGDDKKHPLGIFIYDPEKNEWSADTLPLPAWRGQCKNAFYAPDLNVFIFHSANDSADDGSIWAYRYHH
jgi:hypothetical protein